MRFLCQRAVEHEHWLSHCAVFSECSSNTLAHADIDNVKGINGDKRKGKEVEGKNTEKQCNPQPDQRVGLLRLVMARLSEVQDTRSTTDPRSSSYQVRSDELAGGLCHGQRHQAQPESW